MSKPGKTLSFAVLLLASSVAAQDKPPTKPECFDAHERAQVAQKEGKLRAAQQDYAICSHKACPKLVQTECAAQLPKVQAAFASVVVSVLDGGKAASDAKLSVDGASVEASGSLELEPGEHVLAAESSDGRRVEKRLTLREGQRGEKVSLDIPAKQVSPEPAPEPAPAPAPNRVSPAVWVLGGVAVVGLAGFVGFGLSGKSQESDLDACKPSCKRDDVDAMRRSYLLADISLGVALAASGVGAYLYVSGNKKRQEQGVYLRALPLGAELGARF